MGRRRRKPQPVTVQLTADTTDFDAQMSLVAGAISKFGDAAQQAVNGFTAFRDALVGEAGGVFGIADAMAMESIIGGGGGGGGGAALSDGAGYKVAMTHVKHPSPTADTWVARNQKGDMEAVKVTAMTDGHLLRWIQYFRKKWRNERGYTGSDAVLDTLIKNDMITAPAIYAEAIRRGVFKPPDDLPLTPATATLKREADRPLTLGVRKIDLHD